MSRAFGALVYSFFKMADPNDVSWRTPAFRQRIIAQIDDVIRQSGNPINKTSVEMENHVYDRARTKDEYLSYVARLILHAREMNAFNKKNSRQSFGMPSDGIANLDPLNALQSMTHQGTNMQSLGPPLSTRNSGDLNSALSMQQPQHSSMSGAVGAFNPGRPIGTEMSGLTPLPPSSSLLPPFITSDLLLPMLPLSDVNSHSPLTPLSVQSFKPSGKMTGAASQHSPGQSSHGQFQSTAVSYGNSRTSQPGSVESMQGSPYVSHSPRQMQGASGHSRGIPSPAQFSSASFCQMTPSPLGYVPSHSPHMVPSPGGPPHHAVLQTPRNTPVTVPSLSPGSALGTPTSMGTVAASPDEQVYTEKVKQLSKYIEPLERLIARIEKDSDKKKELSKMTSLRDILTNHTHKRLPYETLLKCEQVLEKMELHVRASEASANIVATLAPTTDLQGKEYNLCQPLYDAVMAHINLPTFSHTLQRTFGPAVAALHGQRSPSPPAKKRKSTELEEVPDVPDVVQGEIARLDRRFKINLNPTYHRGSRTVHLVCQLDDKNLPCVPPITIMVPENYPTQAPQCNAKFCDYGATDFLQAIYHNLTGRLAKLPTQVSITSLLDTWEMSVRQACAPRTQPPSVSK